MSEDLTFDPQLPELPLALDRGAVAQLFATRWPAGEPPETVRSCRLRDVKYQPGRRCVASYELEVERGGAPARTIGVVELTPDGLAHRLYDDDPRLPWLAEAADVRRMAPRFAALLGEVVLSCSVTPVRYRAGARCVFRYELSTPSRAVTIFGKLLEPGAAELAATVDALHRASVESPAMPHVPPPLAYWPELRMVLQPEVAGRAELNDLAFSQDVELATRERWLRDAGLRLAGLHALQQVPAPSRTLDEDLAELWEYLAPMAAADPALARRYEAAVDQVAAAVRDLPEPPRVASHGAFRTDQFLIQDDRLVLIDLDGFCWANPARDIGNFLAYLRWKAIRQPQRAGLIEQAGERFLEGYEAVRPGVDARWLAVCRAMSMLKIAGRRYRSLTVKEWPLVPALLDAAQLALQ